MLTTFALLTGYIADLIFGDPPRLPHPVRGIGFMISRGERLLLGAGHTSGRLTRRRQYLSGVVLTIMVISVSYVIPYYLLFATAKINLWLAFGLEALMCYLILATKSLKDESMQVYQALIDNDLPTARKKLSRLVSRDTDNLDSSEVAKGAVETVSENTSDGVIAPLMYILIGGAPLGFLYKAINTLDSMIGYKNEKYMDFGRFAAKLDDLANIIPARVSAYLMIAASLFAGYDAKNAFKMYRRDRYNHPSPNSAHTEAVCAGALNIQLAGDNYYFGELVSKPTIGDSDRTIEAEDIKRANRLLYITSFLALLVGVSIRLTILMLI